MKIEIEFRGKDAVTGEWRHGHYFEVGADRDSYIKEFSQPTRDLMKSYRVKKETVGQYSGRKDSDKVKIFTGDIIRDEIFHRTGVVGFKRGAFGIYHTVQKTKCFNPIYDQCKVIGNIFDK